MLSFPDIFQNMPAGSASRPDTGWGPGNNLLRPIRLRHRYSCSSRSEDPEARRLLPSESAVFPSQFHRNCSPDRFQGVLHTLQYLPAVSSHPGRIYTQRWKLPPKRLSSSDSAEEILFHSRRSEGNHSLIPAGSESSASIPADSHTRFSATWRLRRSLPLPAGTGPHRIT